MSRYNSLKGIIRLANRIAARDKEDDSELSSGDLFAQYLDSDDQSQDDQSQDDQSQDDQSQDSQDEDTQVPVQDEQSQDDYEESELEESELEESDQNEYTQDDSSITTNEYACRIDLNLDILFEGNTTKKELLNKIKSELKNAIISGMQIVSDDLGLSSADVKVRPIKLECAIVSGDSKDHDIFGRTRPSLDDQSEEQESEEDEDQAEESEEVDQYQGQDQDQEEQDQDQEEQDQDQQSQDQEDSNYDYDQR